MGVPETLHYGPNGPTESDLRLVGDVGGKRVLELGCGDGSAAIELERCGAHVIAVDKSVEVVSRARRSAEREEAKVEWHQTDLADLAFMRADSVDLAYSFFAFGEIEDLSRVFRQVHRVLRPNACLVFSYEHPALMSAPGAANAISRSYFERGPFEVIRNNEPVKIYAHPVGEVFAALGRSGFRVDAIVEPEPDTGMLPPSIIWRARKEGS